MSASRWAQQVRKEAQKREANKKLFNNLTYDKAQELCLAGKTYTDQFTSLTKNGDNYIIKYKDKIFLELQPNNKIIIYGQNDSLATRKRLNEILPNIKLVKKEKDLVLQIISVVEFPIGNHEMHLVNDKNGQWREE